MDALENGAVSATLILRAEREVLESLYQFFFKDPNRLENEEAGVQITIGERHNTRHGSLSLSDESKQKRIQKTTNLMRVQIAGGIYCNGF